MKKTIRVLMICMEYPPFVAGGLGIHYFELTSELKKYCQIDLLCARFNDATPAEESKGNLSIHRLLVPKMFPLNHIVFNLKATYRGLKMRKDLVHICSPFGLFTALLTRKPLVIKIHSIYKSQRGNWIYNSIFFPIASLIDKLLVRKSDLVLTTSKFMKSEILHAFSLSKQDQGKVKVIYNGVNKSFFDKTLTKSKARQRLNIDKSLKVILYVGRFVKRKNALSIIESIPEILKKEKDILFIFVGGGFNEGSDYQRHIFSTLKKYKLEGTVRIVPWIPHSRLIEYYRASDIFIHLAEYEPFGNNVLEAMAAGLPIIATNKGGPKEIVGNNGILLDKITPVVIRDSLVSLLASNKLARSFASKSMKRANQLSWKNTAIGTVKLYRELLSEDNKVFV